METYNRKIRLEPWTLADSLRLCYQCVEREKKALDLIDTHNQGLSMDYQSTMLDLMELFTKSGNRELITNNFNEELNNEK